MNLKLQDDYTPVALYARVSSDRQDVDLSVSAQLGHSETTPRRTVTWPPASTWTIPISQPTQKPAVLLGG